MEISNIAVPPFDLGSNWHGSYISCDSAIAGPITKEDVEAILHYGDTGDTWDGVVACVMRLKDSRYVAYETWWGPTGNGFSEDAYGGDADIYFAYDLKLLVATALTDAGRELCGLPREGL